MNTATSLQLDCLAPTASVGVFDAALRHVQSAQWAALCVPPFWVKKYRRELGLHSAIRLVTVIGYPYGFQRTEAKITEIEHALLDGADECELVFNASALYSSTASWLKIEFAKAALLLHQAGKSLTVVIEPAWINTPEQLQQVCKYAADAGADFVKDGTGLYPPQPSITPLVRHYLPAGTGYKTIALPPPQSAEVVCLSVESVLK